MPSEPTLQRTLSLWQVSVTGIGVILGAGVYALIGPAAARAGHGLWLSFLLAGAAAALTAYSYARLGAMRPKTSPEFQYTSLAFGPDVGFVAGWLMLGGDIAAAASVALGFGDISAIWRGRRSSSAPPRSCSSPRWPCMPALATRSGSQPF
jgi:APA family basic amino acid/polyamine antiporter